MDNSYLSPNPTSPIHRNRTMNTMLRCFLICFLICLLLPSALPALAE